LFAYEIKWKAGKNPAAPESWQKTYGDKSEWRVVTPENLLEFL
jgi:hypothetical protein